jgi:hypothetical protein
MATGTGTYMGLALPLYGEALMTQITGATDILTIQGANGQSGDFLVIRDSTATERLVVEDGGNVVMTQKAAADIGLKIVQYSTPTASAISITSNDGSTNRFAITKNHGILMRSRTTKPTTGMTKGEIFLLFHNTNPKIAVCSSTATQKIKIIANHVTTTLGRAT